MRTHYTTEEFVEWLGASLKEHLDIIYTSEYNKRSHLEDLLVSTEMFVEAIAKFIYNTPK